MSDTSAPVVQQLSQRPIAGADLERRRAENAELIERVPDAENRSIVRLRLTERGAAQLETLSELHLTELAHLAPTMHALWAALEDGDGV